MIKSKKKALLALSFSLLLGLAACGEEGKSSIQDSASSSQSSSSEGNSSSSSASSESSASSSSSSSSSEDLTVEVTSVSLALEGSLKAGESAKLSFSVLPENATDKSLVFSSSDPETLVVDQDGTLHALKTGTATVTARAANGVEGKLEVTVVPSSSELSAFLKGAKTKEAEGFQSGTLQESTGSTYEFRAYKDAVQTKKTDASGSAVTSLRSLRSSVVNTLTLTSSSITSEDVEVNKGIDEAMAKDQTTLFQYDLKLEGSQEAAAAYGLSGLASNLFTGDYFGTAEAQKNLAIELKEDAYRVRTYQATSLGGIRDSEMTLSFDTEKRLTGLLVSFETYAAEDFDATKGSAKDGASPTATKTIEGSLVYGERPESDDWKLSESNYRVKSFDVDTSGFHLIAGKAVLYLGESVPLLVTNESPAIHLKDSYSVESFSPTGIVTEDGGYLTARSIGVTTMTVVSGYAARTTLEIEVREVPVSGISFIGHVESLEVGESVTLAAQCSPYAVKDAPYTMAFQEAAQSEFATLTALTDGSGKYSLKGVKAGKVTVVASVTEDPSISASMTIEITDNSSTEGPADELQAVLLSKPYKSTYAKMTFLEDHTGTFVNNFGGKASYTFGWTLADGVVTFKDILLVSGDESGNSRVIISNEYTKTGTLSADGKTITVSQAIGAQNTFPSNQIFKQ